MKANSVIADAWSESSRLLAEARRVKVPKLISKFETGPRLLRERQRLPTDPSPRGKLPVYAVLCLLVRRQWRGGARERDGWGLGGSMR